MNHAIGKIGPMAKIAARLFRADSAVLGAQVQELEGAGVDWFHVEVRDGKYIDFGMPRGGFDTLEAVRKCIALEIEAQLQMVRPSLDVFKQLADLGLNLITLPLETMGEPTMQSVTYIKDALGSPVGASAWQGTPISAFEQYLTPYVDIVEYASRAHFWVRESGQSPHTLNPLMLDNIHRPHAMVAAAGRRPHQLSGHRDI